MANIQSERHRILPQLSLLDAVSITIGSIIGSGIFISPKGVFQNVGSVGLSFFVWIFCGIIEIFSSLCWVELALAMPKFGGQYHYLREIYGDFPAFTLQWLVFCVRYPASMVIRTLTFSEYILAPFFESCDVPPISLKLVSLLITMLCGFMNAVSVRVSKGTVNFLMAAKILALAIIIITGLVYLCINGDQNGNFENSFENINWTKLGLAYYAAIWSYGGGDNMMAMTEEFRNPRRDFPKATIISIVMVIFLYILANVAYFAVLTPNEMLDSNAVAVTFSEKTLGSFRWVIPILVSLSAMPMTGFLSAPRSFYATARDGMFPESIALVSIKYKTPIGSILICCILILAYLFFDIWTLITYLGFVSTCCDGLALSTIFVLRWFRPDINKPFKVPIAFPIIALVTYVGGIILAAISAPMKALVGLALTMTVIPAYLLGVYPRTKVALAGKISGIITRFFQILTVSLPEDKEE
ncbi:large neutral amino acids transporter small subunit 2-like [Antedon mediterranea]|uniref:large neutral amino acids transporter small subunit 2-like n=1 Tax=Antedon mediterranea TaxID=105859 RepID=UPI003AF84CC2